MPLESCLRVEGLPTIANVFFDSKMRIEMVFEKSNKLPEKGEV
jgi:hypothetical protein